MLLKEVAIIPYIKDLSQFEIASEYDKNFDISNWNFYMAFDGSKPVGVIALVTRTPGLDTLCDEMACAYCGILEFKMYINIKGLVNIYLI